MELTELQCRTVDHLESEGWELYDFLDDSVRMKLMKGKRFFNCTIILPNGSTAVTPPIKVSLLSGEIEELEFPGYEMKDWSVGLIGNPLFLRRLTTGLNSIDDCYVVEDTSTTKFWLKSRCFHSSLILEEVCSIAAIMLPILTTAVLIDDYSTIFSHVPKRVSPSLIALDGVVKETEQKSHVLTSIKTHTRVTLSAVIGSSGVGVFFPSTRTTIREWITLLKMFVHVQREVLKCYTDDVVERWRNYYILLEHFKATIGEEMLKKVIQDGFDYELFKRTANMYRHRPDREQREPPPVPMIIQTADELVYDIVVPFWFLHMARQKILASIRQQGGLRPVTKTTFPSAVARSIRRHQANRAP